VSGLGLALFAPDNELHGVLARQRELAELASAIAAATSAAEAAKNALDVIERDLAERQTRLQQENAALASQQRRCHGLELELVQLRQAAETAARRRAQITQESEDLAAQHA